MKMQRIPPLFGMPTYFSFFGFLVNVLTFVFLYHKNGDAHAALYQCMKMPFATIIMALIVHPILLLLRMHFSSSEDAYHIYSTTNAVRGAAFFFRLPSGSLRQYVELPYKPAKHCEVWNEQWHWLSIQTANYLLWKTIPRHNFSCRLFCFSLHNLRPAYDMGIKGVVKNHNFFYFYPRLFR